MSFNSLDGPLQQTEMFLPFCKHQDQGPCESCQLADRMVCNLFRRQLPQYTFDQLVGSVISPTKRPMNSFMIFRKALTRYLHEINQAGKLINGKVISLIATKLWKQMDSGQKKRYIDLSTRLEGTHKSERKSLQYRSKKGAQIWRCNTPETLRHAETKKISKRRNKKQPKGSAKKDANDSNNNPKDALKNMPDHNNDLCNPYITDPFLTDESNLIDAPYYEPTLDIFYGFQDESWAASTEYDQYGIIDGLFR
ncbi:10999_t:CDS:1, partial [Paraglomus brasilianum]